MKARRGALVVCAALLLGSSLAACVGGDQSSSDAADAEPYRQTEAGLSSPLLESTPMTIGVVVGPVEGAGAEYRPLVEGATLAAYRFRLSSGRINLVAVLDDGTPSGALDAVESLLDEGVSAILVASHGDEHLTDAIDAAHAADTAVISLYSPIGDQDAWSIAPDTTAVDEALVRILSEENATKPYVVTAATHHAPMDGARVGTITEMDGTADAIAAAIEAREVDSVVVSGSAAVESALVNALESRLDGAQIPILLTPEAQTPSFARSVVTAGASEGRLITVGTPSTDVIALSPDASGSAASAFFSAMRLAAGDESCTNVFKDGTCAESIRDADTASHDAVVALVRAAEAADSVEPSAVRDALSTLTVNISNGLVGPPLDFRNRSALPSSALKRLRASTSDPGLRPVAPEGTASSSLFWFAQ